MTYELSRIAKILAAGGAVFLLYTFVKLDFFEVVWKVVLLALFMALMYWMKFFQQSELRAVAALVTRDRRGPGTSQVPASNGISEPK